MDDPLSKTAQDHYTYRINNFHPSLDNIITISILNVRFEGQVYTGQPIWRNARVINGSINIYPNPPQSSRTTWMSRDEDRLSPISCFPNNYYEYFVSISWTLKLSKIRPYFLDFLDLKTCFLDFLDLKNDCSSPYIISEICLKSPFFGHISPNFFDDLFLETPQIF